MRYKWDFFIAHAGGDTNIAKKLYALLKPHSKVFLDSEELILGDTWDSELTKAQRQSLITIVIVSSKTEKAYYQREEIAVAIQMARDDKQKHRVIPVFMPGYEKDTVPYGLTILHSLILDNVVEIDIAAEKILVALNKVRKRQKSTKKDESTETIFKKELEALSEAREKLTAQINIFSRARIAPQDCDETVHNFLAVKELLNQVITNDNSIEIANHLVILYKLDEGISELINILSQFRNVSVQIDDETENTKQEITTHLHDLINNIDSLILNMKA